ncbi:MAG TPA: TonB-dependent receptor, partial [Saprospiraceae bacterium]|nr:TonB-dependent receptor [Saprospiraceae bacterium]
TLELMNAIGLDFGTGSAIPQYKDLAFKINVPTKKAGIFNLIGMGGVSFIELHDSETSLLNKEEDLNYNYGGMDLDYGSDLAVLGLSHQYFLNDRSRLETCISALGNRATTHSDSLKFDDEGSIIQNSNYLFYDARGTEIKYSFSTHLKTKLNAANNTSFGLYYDLYDVYYLDSVRFYPVNGFIKNFDIDGNISSLRAYGQWQHFFGSKWKMNTGLNATYTSVNDEFVVEPRLSMKYNFTPAQSLSFGYGLHSIMQPRMFYFIQALVDTANLVYTQNNLNLKMTKSHQLVVAYDHVFSEDFRFKSEAYYQYLFDVPVSKTTPQFSLLNSGDSFTFLIGDSLVNKSVGYNYGLEVTLEKFFDGNYYFLTTLSLFESKYKGYDEVERNTSFNGNFVWNVLGGYEFKLGKHNSISLSMRSVYAGGKRYIPIDLEKSIEQNFTAYDWNKAYENKYGDYFRMDGRLSFKMNGKRVNQEWAIDLQNFTNNKNIYLESFNPRTKNTSYDYQTGFYPMFLYRIQF